MKKNQKLKPSQLHPHRASRLGVWAGLPYCSEGKLIALVLVGAIPQDL